MKHNGIQTRNIKCNNGQQQSIYYRNSNDGQKYDNKYTTVDQYIAA